MITVLRMTPKTTLITCLTISAAFTVTTKGLAETSPQLGTAVAHTQKQEAIAPTQFSTLRAQVSPAQLNSIFTPPPRPAQQSSTYVNYRITSVKERGDRPQLRDIMRLEPAALPSFVYKN